MIHRQDLLVRNADALRPVNELDHRVTGHVADDNDDNQSASDHTDRPEARHRNAPSVRIGILL